MNDKAYHLQPAAHAAVSRAIAAGKLTRLPCEVCSASPSQAHHDSYYPEKWLEVRWLCPAHHREWHAANEPDWPTVFDYHPTDRANAGTTTGTSLTGSSGRPPKPWFRSARNCWCVCLNGTQHNLGPDRERAFTRFHELLASEPRYGLIRNDTELSIIGTESG
jgi:hypothetical protein